jgi:putative spermidine/putrescine transport system substrate-binding protein
MGHGWRGRGDDVDCYSGRIAVAAQQGSPLAVVWPGSPVHGTDYGSTKGSRHVDQGETADRLRQPPDTQVRYVQQILWGRQNNQGSRQAQTVARQLVPTSPQTWRGAGDECGILGRSWRRTEQRFNARQKQRSAQVTTMMTATKASKVAALAPLRMLSKVSPDYQA